MIRFGSLAALALLGFSPASAADLAQPAAIPYAAVDTVCGGPGVLGTIQHRFAYGARNTGLGSLAINSIADPRPSGHPYSEPGYVKRDYCMANAVLSDGSTRLVYYTIEHGLGFAGIGRSVDFCVAGLDPWHIHDGDCRTVR
jgi:opacity protein-like surface antigen